MHTICHIHVHDYMKTMELLRALNLTHPSSGSISSSFVQNTSNYFCGWNLISCVMCRLTWCPISVLCKNGYIHEAEWKTIMQRVKGSKYYIYSNPSEVLPVNLALKYVRSSSIWVWSTKLDRSEPHHVEPKHVLHHQITWYIHSSEISHSIER